MMKIISYALIIFLFLLLLNTKLNVIDFKGADTIIMIIIMGYFIFRLIFLVIKKNATLKK